MPSGAHVHRSHAGGEIDAQLASVTHRGVEDPRHVFHDHHRTKSTPRDVKTNALCPCLIMRLCGEASSQSETDALDMRAAVSRDFRRLGAG
jgi:hypothetical protein